MGLAELDSALPLSSIARSFNLPGRFGFGRTPCVGDSPAPDRAVSICQADLGLAELLPQAATLMGHYMFQSARQIWVWPNSSLSGLAGSSTVRFQSARQIWVWPNNDTSRNASWFIWFQSARQIWVWPNPASRLRMVRSESFNLPGRFGFGRTRTPKEIATELGKTFQSARQIWVWPNGADWARAAPSELVSICQADLGLAELYRTAVVSNILRVSICQADLGLAEPIQEGSIGIELEVSICQADLGLAERQETQQFRET
mgnify:CR=1 FL=1